MGDSGGTESPLLTVTPGGVIAAGLLLPLLACSAVLLRFFARRWQHLHYGVDDWTILVSGCLTIVLGVILITGAGLGALGQHSRNNAEAGEAGASSGQNGNIDSMERTAERVAMAYSIVEKPALTLVKISVVLLYRRVLQGRTFSRIAVAICVIMASTAAAFLFASALQCPYNNWVGMEINRPSNCAPQELVTLAFAIADCVMDVVVLALPIPVVWQLHADRRRRLYILLIFSLSNSSLLVALVRMAIVCRLVYAPGATSQYTYRDTLGFMSVAVVLSLVEVSLAVIAACLPTVRNLLAATANSTSSAIALGNPGAANFLLLPPMGNNAVTSSNSPNEVENKVAQAGLTMATATEEWNGGKPSLHLRTSNVGSAISMTTPTTVVDDEEQKLLRSSRSASKSSFGGAFPLQKLSSAVSSGIDEPLPSHSPFYGSPVSTVAPALPQPASSATNLVTESTRDSAAELAPIPVSGPSIMITPTTPPMPSTSPEPLLQGTLRHYDHTTHSWT